MNQPLAWPELKTRDWKITWQFKWRGWNWTRSTNFYGWSIGTPIGCALFTRYAR